MDSAAIFTLRSSALKRRLEWLQRAISPEGVELDPSQKAFTAEIERLRASFRDQLQGQTGDRNGWISLNALEDSWKNLFSSGLTYIHATQRRATDEPVQYLARSLVAELAAACDVGSPPLIAPDMAESYSDYVPIIRMRFPAPDIWDLPVLAHEFGHWASYRLTMRPESGLGRSQPLADVIKRAIAGQKDELEQQRREHWINEFFADMFATYVLGFAFAAYALLLRFDLARPYQSQGKTHPSYADRAEFILYTLERMEDDFEDDPEAREVIAGRCKWLADRWKDLLATSLAFDQGSRFLPDKGELYDAMTRVAGIAKYSGWERADRETRFVIDGSRNSDGTLSPRDLLNAAYLDLADGRAAEALDCRVLALWHSQGTRKKSQT